MIDPVPGDDAADTRQALHRFATDSRDLVALHTLAHSEILVPVPPDAPAEVPGTMDLTVLHRPGTAPVVPVFTSVRRLLDALPGTGRYRRVPLVLLANAWPSDDLALAIDTGTSDAVTLNAEGVQSLLGRPGG